MEMKRVAAAASAAVLALSGIASILVLNYQPQDVEAVELRDPGDVPAIRRDGDDVQALEAVPDGDDDPTGDDTGLDDDSVGATDDGAGADLCRSGHWNSTLWRSAGKRQTAYSAGWPERQNQGTDLPAPRHAGQRRPLFGADHWSYEGCRGYTSSGCDRDAGRIGPGRPGRHRVSPVAENRLAVPGERA